MILKNITICSGGQSGVDRAALDFAIQNNIECGGWCPKGRLAEDGIIADSYPLEETQSSNTEERTKLNIIDSDGTLILFENIIDSGTQLTLDIIRKLNKPSIIIKLPVDNSYNNQHFYNWLIKNRITVLNIAGPRESSNPGIYNMALSFFENLI